MSFSLNAAVTPEMVSSFYIDARCLEMTRPQCDHGCVITLEDGRIRSASLRAPEIHTLINSIALKNINSSWEAGHFEACGEKIDSSESLTKLFNS